MNKKAQIYICSIITLLYFIFVSFQSNENTLLCECEAAASVCFDHNKCQIGSIVKTVLSFVTCFHAAVGSV